MGSGYSVTPSLITPWRASLHHWYAGTLSRGIAAELFCICVAFSARVIRCTKSVALCSGVKLVSRYGAVAVLWAIAGCRDNARQSVPALSTNVWIIFFFMLNLKSEIT